MRLLENREPPKLRSNNMDSMIAMLPSPRPHEKPDVLLVSLSKLFPRPGQSFTCDWHKDGPLACAMDGAELKHHMHALLERGLLAGELNSATITWQGWEHVDRLTTTATASRTAFVAMQFSEEMVGMWRESFGAAIERADFDPILANEPQHNEQIDAKIIAQIKQARFVVADVTGARTGVYFEAGYALGIGRPVIWTCRESNEADMHFDTRQYNHILWKDAADLADKLYYRIVATI